MLPQVMKLADEPGHRLSHHVHPLEVGRLVPLDQVEDVEVPVEEHRGRRVPHELRLQRDLLFRSQNLEQACQDLEKWLHLLPVDPRVSVSEPISNRHLPDA